ncbi:MAG TPA: hypothetical protein VFE51_04115 [Verrucomicrobiae bacterium]|nr:hypothetical protein [Verrucomicrobiae bacterium]
MADRLEIYNEPDPAVNVFNALSSTPDAIRVFAENAQEIVLSC